MYFFFPLRKKVALINLKIAFPKKSSYELKEILKKCYIHFGILASDFFRLPKLKKDNIHQIITLDQKSKKILDSNHAIIMSAHLGNWELIIPMMGYNNYKMAVVTQTQKNKSGEKFFNWIRDCDNIKLISKKNSIHEMSKALNENYFLALASDQSAGMNGTLNLFFNKNTSTPKGAAIFHFKKNIPIIIMFLIRQDNHKYILHIKKLNPTFNDEDKEHKIKTINDLYNLELEKIVKKYPEQYFWFHRKWDKDNYL